ncbi:hypothetical protein ACTJJ0_23785 [Chitinophaga sp. 22321]|uniref:Uncharacterized protein n=1 Tax=Chitinophaga hostae TaxID=2831022 RepID=A0ABS5J5C6_9BACT|nr:hypothetical protein [Chitinophaga hostae]MBS0030283.1 hypothetical protein [Chitinophaga hostae]
MLTSLCAISLRRYKGCLLLVWMAVCSHAARAQETNAGFPKDSAATVNAPPVPSKLAAQSLRKWSAYKAQLMRRSGKQLNAIKKTDLDIYRKLFAFDSIAAKNLYPEGLEKMYDDKIAGIKSKSSTALNSVTGAYQPYVDSLRGILSFADKYKLGGAAGKVKESLASINELQGKLHEADQVKEFIQQRKAMIKEYLSQYKSLPSGLKDSYDKLNKDLYYYSAQLREYKESLNDPDKMLKKTLALMNKVPAFKSFMEKNSMLSELFGGSAGAESVLRGSADLVTREQIQSRIQTQLTGGGASAAGALSQQLRAARQQVDNLQSKVMANGQEGGNVDLPDGYTPNNLKKKTLWQRLEYSWNLQNLPATNVLPVISALGLSAGYKISENAVAGIGAAYQLGLGKGINELKLSNQGVGLRTFFDMKLKNTFWLSAAAEENYMHEFSKIEEIRHLQHWQKSALIGIMKKTKIGKQTNSIQVLFDVLASQQVPRGQLLKIRLAHKL